MLAGDHKQLAPTVKSHKAATGLGIPARYSSSSSPPLSSSARVPPSGSTAVAGADGSGRSTGGGADGLGLTMFDRVLRDLGHDVCRMLDVQYRMNRDICDWASSEVGIGEIVGFCVGTMGLRLKSGRTRFCVFFFYHEPVALESSKGKCFEVLYFYGKSLRSYSTALRDRCQ